MNTNKIKDTAEAIKGIVEAVPIYQDLAQPAIKEFGKGLHTLSKTIHIALAPVAAMVWGYEKIKEKVNKDLETKLENVPKESIVPPNPRVAGPLIESLKYTAQDDKLREMYTSLLASSMNKEKRNEVHPSFVEIIRQLQPDEAKLLHELSLAPDNSIALLNLRVLLKQGGGKDCVEYFSKLHNSQKIENKGKIPTYIENLERLKLVRVPASRHLVNHDVYYKPLKGDPYILNYTNYLKSIDNPYEFTEGYLELTNFGKDFIKVCI